MEKPNKPKQPKEVRAESIGKVSIKLIFGDVAQVPASVIVCPTNESLQRNSGMTEHIIRSAGARVHYEKNAWRKQNESLSQGEIFVCQAGDLQSNHIFFSSVPECNKNNPEPQIKFFIAKVLEKLEEFKAGTVNIPCLPKEAYGYLPENCAFGYLTAIQDYLNSNPDSQLLEVKIVTIDKNSRNIFMEEFNRKFGVKKVKKGLFSFLKRKKKKNDDDMNIELK